MLNGLKLSKIAYENIFCFRIYPLISSVFINMAKLTHHGN